MTEEIVLTVDERPAERAYERANLAAERHEKRAVQSHRAASRAAEDYARSIEEHSGKAERSIQAIEKTSITAARAVNNVMAESTQAVISVKEFAGAVVSLTTSLAGYILIAGKSVTVTQKVVNAYRAVRLAVSPTIFTATTIGIGIAAEALGRFAYHQGELAERTELAAAQLKISVAEYRQTATAARFLGSTFEDVRKIIDSMDDSGLERMGIKAGASADQFLEVARSIGAIPDPARRAAATVAVFGDKLSPEMYAKFNGTLAESVRLFESLAYRPDAAKLDQFKRDLDTIGQGFDNLKARAKAVGESFKGIAVDTVTFLYDLSKSFGEWNVKTWSRPGMEAVGDFIGRMGPGTPAMVGAGTTLALQKQQAAQPRQLTFEEIAEEQKKASAAAIASLRPVTPVEFRGFVPEAPFSQKFTSTIAYQQEQLGDIQARLKREQELFAELRHNGDIANANIMAAQIKQTETAYWRQKQLVEQAEKSEQATKDLLAEQKRAQEQAQKFFNENVAPRITARRRLGAAFDTMFAGGPAVMPAMPQFKEAAEVVEIEALKASEMQRKRAEKDYADSLKFQEQTLQQQLDNSLYYLDRELQVTDAQRDKNLAAIESYGQRDIASRVTAEERKFAITREYAEKEAKILVERLRIKTDLAKAELEIEKQLNPARAAEIDQRISAIIESSGIEAAKIQDKYLSQIDRARAESISRQNEIIISEQQRQFESLKNGFEGIFDALVLRSENAWQAMKRSLISIFLTPVKEEFARLAASLFTGIRAPSYGYGGGSAGGFRGILGGFGGMLGGGGGGGHGGTPPFWGGGGASGTGGGWSQAGGWVGMMGGWKDSLSRLGNIGFGPKGGDFGGEVAGSFRGVGGWQGGALLAGGGVLAAMGLQRGGWSGLGMTTAGGAMIGAKFGGWEGAAIGAAAGFVAGMVRKLFKGATDKAVEKVKALYGVQIDKQFAKQLVEMAKSQFGGNLDLAIRSQQIRDMILLYKQMTAQGSTVYDDRPRGVFLSQGAGGLTQTGTYVNGALFGYSSGLNSAPGLRVMNPNPAATQQNVYVTIQADGQATADLIEGRQVAFVQSNPGAIQAASIKAQSTGRGRLAAAAQILDPLAVGA